VVSRQKRLDQEYDKKAVSLTEYYFGFYHRARGQETDKFQEKAKEEGYPSFFAKVTEMWQALHPDPSKWMNGGCKDDLECSPAKEHDMPFNPELEDFPVSYDHSACFHKETIQENQRCGPYSQENKYKKCDAGLRCTRILYNDVPIHEQRWACHKPSDYT